MFWTEEKLAARVRELAGFRYREVRPFAELWFRLASSAEVGDRPQAWTDYEAIQVGHPWQGRDQYAWLNARVHIPGSWRSKQVVGLFDFGKTGGGGNSGFESLLFINGLPYQGVDMNHQEVFLPDHLVDADVACTFQLWSGLEGGGPRMPQQHAIRRAEIGWLDEPTDDLYFTAKAALETVKVLSPDRFERSQLLSVLDRAFQAVSWVDPGSEAFYVSVAQAVAVLKNGIDKIERTHPVTVHCVGHTHIDVAWLWRLKHTREKAARSFSTVLRLMEKFPEYIFLQTQPQLYDYIKSDYPEIYAQIADRVGEGRWEAGGAMWLEADCNLTSGESLVRQLLMGTRFFRSEFGAECRYLWLPDVFGYSWALPQILKKSGIDTFMTTKISWNQYNRMPHDTFWWRGMDGSTVLTHFITTPEDSDWWWYTYNGVVTPQSVHGVWNTYRDKEINQDLLLSYGYGDGGGGVNREMLEMRRRLADMPGLPRVETGRADDYFHRLTQTVAATEGYVHTWDGELYLEYHRGTYTSQAYNKRMNRKLELLYRETEWLAALAAVCNRDWSHYPADELQAGWKIILRNQFHDIIPGSSIREVYEDSRVEYDEAHRLGRTAWRAAAAGVTTGSTGALTVFNSAPWQRTDLLHVADLPQDKTVCFSAADGTRLPAQPCSTGGWLVQLAELPSMGAASIAFASDPAAGWHNTPDGATTRPFAYAECSLQTPFYAIEWNGAGQLTRVHDKQHARDVLAAGARGNVLQVFEDKPKMHDAWDIDIFYQQKMSEVADLQSARCVEIGPLRAVVRFEWRYHQSVIVQDLVVYSDNRRIDFPTIIDWHERQQLLKVAFAVDIRATEATYDIQYGNVRRPTHWNTSWDMAKFETVGHQWADLSERGYGVSLLNDCKYGHDIKDNVIRLSLIKSAIQPDTEADQGEHRFTYSLLPHAGDWVAGNTAQAAWALNNPLTYCAGRLAAPMAMLRLSAPNVMVDAVKKAEDGQHLIVRVHEFTGQRCRVTLASDLPIRSWQPCDLMERPAQDASTTAELVFDMRPYEICTFRVEMG